MPRSRQASKLIFTIGNPVFVYLLCSKKLTLLEFWLEMRDLPPSLLLFRLLSLLRPFKEVCIYQISFKIEIVIFLNKLYVSTNYRFQLIKKKSRGICSLNVFPLNYSKKYKMSTIIIRKQLHRMK